MKDLINNTGDFEMNDYATPPERIKIESDDYVLNTILQFSKTNINELSNVNTNNNILISKLKQKLIHYYDIPNFTHDHLLKILFDKYNKILLDKRFDVYKSIDSIILDLLKFTYSHNTEAETEHIGTTVIFTYITHEVIIKQLLIEIYSSKVDWIDYNQT